MSARGGKSGPGQQPQDQKKIYMEWANHYLRKKGHKEFLSDLKDIANGSHLPNVIQAVVNDEVPNIKAGSTSPEDKLANLSSCLEFLRRTGVNCSSFAAKDICDGNMRAILSLFYNLSQFKRTSKTSTTSITSNGSDTPPPSRIARPVSPGIKMTHGVKSGLGVGGVTASPGLARSAPGPSSQPQGVGVARRTAGSTIPTSTSYDKPFSHHRRIPYKSVAVGDGDSLSQGSTTAPLDGHMTNGVAETSPGSETPESDIPQEIHAKTSTGRLTKPGSFSFSHSKKDANNKSQLNKGSESHLPPTRSMSTSHVSHLKRQRDISKEPVLNEDAPGESAANEDSERETSRPPSRLKYPGSSGRTTPSRLLSGRVTPSTGVGGRSGLQRPSGHGGKLSEKSGSTMSLNEDGSKPAGSGKLRIQRKSSDSAIKKHSIQSSITPPSKTIESGTSSLPRNLPKGILSGGGSGLIAPGSHHKGSGSGLIAPSNSLKRSVTSESRSSELESSTSSATSSTSHEGEEPTRKSVSVGESGIRKPGGLRKPSNFSAGGSHSSTSTQCSSPSLSRKKESDIPIKEHSTTASRALFSGSPSQRKRLIASSKIGSGAVHKEKEEVSQAIGGSHSSLDSCEESREMVALTKPGPSRAIDEEEVKSEKSRPPPSLTISEERKEQDVVSPPEGFKSITDIESGRGRRISPEGMSHEDAATLKENETITEPGKEKDSHVESISTEEGALTHKPSPSGSQSGSTKTNGGLISGSQPETGQRYSEGMNSPHLTHKDHSKENGHPESSLLEEKGFKPSENSAFSPASTDNLTTPSISMKRSRSASPKMSYHVSPIKGHLNIPSNLRQHDLHITRTASSGSTPPSNNSGWEQSPQKPLKSSLRNTSSDVGSRQRNHSSSSLESNKGQKVTISPRSSQLVYDPSDPLFILSPKASPDRPVSLTSSSASDSLSPPGSVQILNTMGTGSDIMRKASIRSAVSERLDYRDEEAFLKAGLPQATGGDLYHSTPELLETFENQLSLMKRDLENKDRMLSMYANSMADLSSKVHLLKKSLEEKDIEIKHLTEEKHGWYDLESHSLAPSRAVSEAGVLSDGCLSDSAMDPGSKGEKKKKKAWKRFSFRKKKEGHMDHLSPNMDTESVISARSTKSLKRTLSKRKTPDLMSISEFVADHRFRDLDTKSTYTLDARSEYGQHYPPILTVWNEEERIRVYQDNHPGVKTKVVLQPEFDSYGIGNDSGFHSNGFSRHSSTSSSIHRDSVSSHSDDGADIGEKPLVLGMLSVAPEISWVTMDTKICDIFMHHVTTFDLEGCLGLNEDSIMCYSVGDQRRQIGNALLPTITPYEAVQVNSEIRIMMKGAGHESCDSLAYKILLNRETLQSYMTMLRETHWLVVMGTKGTCKTSLASGLAHHLSLCLSGEEDVEELMVGQGGEIISFNLDKEGLDAPVKYIKNDLVKRIQLQLHPPIILLEDIYDCQTLEQVLATASNLPKKPYIIATLLANTARGIPLHQLLFHHQIRVITCNPQSEPIAGILSRSLRKQVYQHKATERSLEPVVDHLVSWLPGLLDHLNTFIHRFHSNVVDLGPRVFMSCPLHQSANEIETWFVSLWNHFIIPYLMGAIMAGIETYTADPSLEWIDVREWVIETYPRQLLGNVNKLQTLNPEDVNWNHVVRPQHRYLQLLKEDKIPDDARSLIH